MLVPIDRTTQAFFKVVTPQNPGVSLTNCQPAEILPYVIIYLSFDTKLVSNTRGYRVTRYHLIRSHLPGSIYPYLSKKYVKLHLKQSVRVRSRLSYHYYIPELDCSKVTSLSRGVPLTTVNLQKTCVSHNMRPIHE